MRKAFGILLAAMLMVAIAACGSKAPQNEPEAYVPAAEIRVSLAFVEEDATVVTRRLEQKDLQAIALACIYYAKNGYRLGTYELVECTFSSQDTLSIWNFEVPDGCAYIEATIASVTYADGVKNTCPGISVWAEGKKVLDLQAYEQNIQKLKAEQVAAAESCPAAAVSLGLLETGKQKLELTAGEQAIKDIMLYALWYDESGAPVDCSGIFVKNAESISSGAMDAKETASYSVEAPAGAAKAKCIIRKVTLADGTVWENEYVYEWAFINHSTFE